MDRMNQLRNSNEVRRKLTNDLTHGQTVGPAGGKGEKAKIKPAMVIELIRINLNQSNKKFTYKKWYLKNVHK